MKTKTDKPATKEEYQLTEKHFTGFAKALVSVPKKELDKALAKDQSKNRKPRPSKS